MVLMSEHIWHQDAQDILTGLAILDCPHELCRMHGNLEQVQHQVKKEGKQDQQGAEQHQLPYDLC